MSPAAALAAPIDAPSPNRVRLERQMAMLARLAEIGMEIAEALGRDACSPTPLTADHPHNAGLVFTRVARAVRMTIVLEQRLAREFEAPARPDGRSGAAGADRRPVLLEPPVGEVARAPVDGGDRTDIERLTDEAYERLTDVEDGDFEGASVDEAVAVIAGDLGLSPEAFARLTSTVARPPTLHCHPGAPQGPSGTQGPHPVPLAPRSPARSGGLAAGMTGQENASGWVAEVPLRIRGGRPKDDAVPTATPP